MRRSGWGCVRFLRMFERMVLWGSWKYLCSYIFTWVTQPRTERIWFDDDMMPLYIHVSTSHCHVCHRVMEHKYSGAIASYDLLCFVSMYLAESRHCSANTYFTFNRTSLSRIVKRIILES